MPENLQATSLDRPAPHDAWLILGKTAAVVFVPPCEAKNLYNHFRNSGLSCSHLPGNCGVDVIDFGKPSVDQERLIRTVFDSCRKESENSGTSSLWCAWLSLLVVAIWLVAALASW
jgi:hypothetical protein